MIHAWTSDIRGVLSIDIIVEYIQLWNLVHEFLLQPDVENSHIWNLSTSGKYSGKSYYGNLFLGTTLFKHVSDPILRPKLNAHRMCAKEQVSTHTDNKVLQK
jgi:hypothetical protein